MIDNRRGRITAASHLVYRHKRMSRHDCAIIHSSPHQIPVKTAPPSKPLGRQPTATL